MNIVMFSINPLFPDVVMGGAPKHLQNIAMHMGELGHDITVLCTRTDVNQLPFYWHDRVLVHPILRYRQPFPQPYDTPAYNLAGILQDVGDVLASADRFYMHDGEFLFPYAYRHIPTVVSLRDNVYPETMLGGFLFAADTLILISESSRQYYLNTVGRFFPQFDERVKVIKNGLNWDRFTYTEPGNIYDVLGIQPSERPIILHPHRPEESKGIMQTIAVVDQLVHEHEFTNLLVLAPQWHTVQASVDLREFYERIENEIDKRGLKEHFFFHGWIPQKLMPEYYSLGSVTFSLGHFVESFGNAVYESMGCGTPSIAARISTHRELMPDHLLAKVDFGDIDGAAQIAAEILRKHQRISPETITYLHEHYGAQRQLSAYADAILNAEVAEPMQYQHPVIDGETKFRLAPWCYVSTQRGIYHDYEAGYLDHAALLRIVNQMPGGFTRRQGREVGITADEFEDLYRRGYLVPHCN